MKTLKESHAVPERKWFMSRHMVWCDCTWPGSWSLTATRTDFNLGVGEMKVPLNRGGEMERVCIIDLHFKPFGFLVWWNQERVCWIGDKAWKTSLLSQD